ncbi:MAG: hypothetical protein SFU83_23985 [Meiothermus sp.]|nr:hypothetical protein [Meiothermus sp.]
MSLRRTPLLLASALLLLAACGPTGTSTGELEVKLTATGISPAPSVTVTGPGGFSDTVSGVGKTFPSVALGTYTVTAEDKASYSVTISDDGSAALSAQQVSAQAQTRDVEVVAGQRRTVSVVYSRSANSLQVNINLPAGVTIPTGTTPVRISGGTPSVNRDLAASQLLTVTLGTYTATASSFTVSGVTYNGTVTGSPANVTATQTTTPTITVTYSAASATVSSSLSPALVAGESLTLTLRNSGGTAVGSPVTVNGPASSYSFANVPPGSYTVSGIGFRAGTSVDTVLQVASTAVTVPGTAPALSVVARGQSGRMMLAGNGAFAPADLNASYSLTDAQLVTGTIPAGTNFIPASGTSTDNIFRVAFDRDGNAYVIYQFDGAANRARIVRIGEANLRSGNLTPTAAGNMTIAESAIGSNNSSEVEPADLAFDASGNLWIANDLGRAISCISAAAMSTAAATGGSVTAANQVLTQAAGLTGDRANTFTAIHTLAFDRSNNLWFVSDGFVGGTSGAGARRARLSRVPAAELTCTGGTDPTTPDILLDFSNGAGPGLPVIKPVAMALAPDGNSFWIADFGGSFQKRTYTLSTTGGVTTITENPVIRNFDADLADESVIRVRIDNATPSATLQTVTMADRITTGGMQQAFGLAFDKQNRLWVATNGNVEFNTAAASDIATGGSTRVLTFSPSFSLTINTGGSCTPANVPPTGTTTVTETVTSCLPAGISTTNRGRAYAFDVSGAPSLTAGIPRTLTPAVTLTAPVDGVGFVGIAFNAPPANTPVNIRPQ